MQDTALKTSPQVTKEKFMDTKTKIEVVQYNRPQFEQKGYAKIVGRVMVVELQVLFQGCISR